MSISDIRRYCHIRDIPLENSDKPTNTDIAKVLATINANRDSIFNNHQIYNYCISYYNRLNGKKLNIIANINRDINEETVANADVVLSYFLKNQEERKVNLPEAKIPVQLQDPEINTKNIEVELPVPTFIVNESMQRELHTELKEKPRENHVVDMPYIHINTLAHEKVSFSFFVKFIVGIVIGIIGLILYYFFENFWKVIVIVITLSIILVLSLM